MTRPLHGTRACYQAGCRCPECRADNRIKAGQWRAEHRDSTIAEISLPALPPRPEWFDHGACRSADIDRDLFFPVAAGKGMNYDRRKLRDAARICDSCPVRQECHEYAVTYRQIGIWGGWLFVNWKRKSRNLIAELLERAS